MTLLVRSPLLAVLGGLAVSLALFDRLNHPLAPLLAPLFATCLALCTHEPHEGGRRGQWLFLCLVLLVTLGCSARIAYVLARPVAPPRSIKTEGTVSWVRPWGRRATVAVLDTPEGGFLLRLPFATLTEGTRLSVEGVTRPLSPAREPGGFDEARYWRARGADAWFSPLKTEVLPPDWSFPRLRFVLYRKLAIYLPSLTGAYLRAAWTGERDPSLAAAHRAWGTSHILAVSGFHVGVIVLCASLFLGKGCLALSALMWGYVLLTGAAPGSLRAGWMLQAALLARPLGRPPASLNGVCLAAVLLLCHCPFLFWDIGWRLSVLCALTLAALAGLGRGKRKWMWLSLSPVLSLVTFPQVAHTFHGVPLVGLFLNLLAPAFFALALPVASLAALLRFWDVPFAPRLLSATEGGFQLWGMLADGAATLIPWSVPWGPFAAWLSAGTFFFLLCRFLRLSAGRTAALTVGGALASFGLLL